MLKSVRQLLLIGLMALTLLGVQAIQESPLHDHTQHGLDCAICHVELNDDSIASNTDTPALPDADGVTYATQEHFFLSQSSSPYKSRAPPTFFL